MEKHKESDNFIIDNKTDDFSWDFYLKQTISGAVPQIYFQHVHKRANTILEPGMKVEVSYVENKKEKFWIATIVMCLGPVVRLRYLGDDDSSNHDLWKMVTNFKPRPLGWSQKSNASLIAPSHLSHINVKEVLCSIENHKTIEENNSFEFEQFVPGMKIEIEDEFRPYKVWIGNILENYGGRLQLRYDTPDSNEPSFWLFYSSSRIHPYGWASTQGAPWSIGKPSHILNNTHGDAEWAALYEMNLFNFHEECEISEIKNYKYRPPQFKHGLKVGMKLEAINPKTMTQISPATIVEVIDEFYFLVQIDHTENQFLVTLSNPYIFPVGWAASHNLPLHTPLDSNFSWDSYLTTTGSVKATFQKSHQLCSNYNILPGMKLEAVNPENKNEICVGTIQSVHGDLLRIKLEIESHASHSNIYLYNFLDFELFPAGWCQSHYFTLTPPHNFVHSSQKNTATPSMVFTPSKINIPKPLADNEKITLYFNHKCSTGPLISKSKLAMQPQRIGPGPVRLVLLDIIKRIANLAYAQMRILRELEAPKELPKGRHKEELKVKYKTKVYKGVIEIASSPEYVEEYCKEVCRKLSTCQNLFGMKRLEECPLNCLEKNRVVKTSREKKRDRAGYDYKSFIWKPTLNPLSLINRTPFQEELEVAKETQPEETVFWNKEKCLRKRKVNVFLEREKKRLQLNDEEETESSKGKESENSGEEEANKKRQVRVAKRPVVEEDTSRRSKRLESKYGENITKKLDIIAATRNFNEKKLRLPQSNPLYWSVNDVYECAHQSRDLRPLADLLKDEEIDGQSLMMLTFPTCLDNLKLDAKNSLLLCRFVEVVKLNFWKTFVSYGSNGNEIILGTEN